MKLSIKEIKANLQRALIKRKLPKEMADTIAEDYLAGELDGKQSHGLMAFPSLLKSLEGYRVKEYKILEKKHALVVMDANELPGSYVGRRLADDLIEMAKTEGAALGFIKNMRTWLRPGAIAQYVADHGMVAFVINNGGKPMVAPPGGYDPATGTNPIGIGVPTNEQPIVVDMATSKRAWGEVRKAKKNNSDLPKDSYYTNTGDFATKPDDAYSAVPMGEYKGFALSLFIEIMTGSFLGRDMSVGLESNQSVEYSDAQAAMRGGMILVMNPAITVGLDQFKKSNAEFIKNIKRGHKLPGVDEIYMPGDRAGQERTKNIKNDFLEVDENLWKQISG